MPGPWTGSNIRWTDDTWNPVHGCARSGSPGCANCYAERVSHKFDNTQLPWRPEHASENIQVKPYKLDELDSLPDPYWVFVNSMSDLYHEFVPDEFIEDVYAKLEGHPTSAFQILTKHGADNDRDVLDPPPNVMLGVSVGHPDWRYRIDWLRDQAAETKFVSVEPLVANIPDLDLTGIDWVIVGGESGPDDVRRPMDPGWARNVIRACRRQDVAVFFKQHSGLRPESDVEIDMQDGRGKRRIEEFPELPEPVVGAPEEFREVVA